MNVAVVTGASTSLNCSSDDQTNLLRWFHAVHPGNVEERIYTGSKRNRNATYSELFIVDNSTSGTFNLNIHTVNAEERIYTGSKRNRNFTYSELFDIDTNNNGTYNLNINTVNESIAGTYTCEEPYEGTRSSAELIVLGEWLHAWHVYIMYVILFSHDFRIQTRWACITLFARYDSCVSV